MNIQTISIALLAGMFVVATVLPINMGALAFACAFLLGGVVMGMKASDIFAGFPADLFLTLVGVTYLFAIAQINGTIAWLIEGAVRLVRGHVAWIPWVMFLVAAVITGFGGLGPAAVAILAPVALGFAVQYRINPVLMGLMVIHGAQAGGFSPISVYGVITNQVVEKAHLPFSTTALFLSSFFFNLGIAVVVVLIFGGWKALRRPAAVFAAAEAPGEIPGDVAIPAETEPARPRLNPERLVTLVGLIALGVGALVLKFNVGFVAITVAVVLALLSPKAQKAAVDKISWSTVLLITGMITYVAVMEKIGTVDWVANGISSLGAPLLVALLLCFTGAIVSAFASSVALLGSIIPLAVPFLLQGELSATGVVAAIAISTTIVDTSPFSTNGALVVANAHEQDREQVLKTLLIYSAAIALIGPVIAWLVLVVPGLV